MVLEYEYQNEYANEIVILREQWSCLTSSSHKSEIQKWSTVVHTLQISTEGANKIDQIWSHYVNKDNDNKYTNGWVFSYLRTPDLVSEVNQGPGLNPHIRVTFCHWKFLFSCSKASNVKIDIIANFV